MEGTSEEKRLQRPPNVISLRGHQQAEQALEDFLSAPAGRGYYTAALSKALGVGAPIVAAATRRLNSTQPDHLLRLGDLLARFPSRQRVVQAMARIAHDPHAQGERRLGASMLLSGLNLDDHVDSDAAYEIADAGETLARTLVSLAGECVSRVEHVSDYGVFFRFILGQPPEVLYSAIGALAGQEDLGDRGGALAALRLLAMHPHPELAEAALDALALDESPEASHNLSVLALNLPPDLSRVADRYLRKRIMSGLTQSSSPKRESEGRALLSAIDGAGRQVLWVRWPNTTEEGEASEATLLIVLSDSVGIATASAARQVLAARFPPETQGGPAVWRPIDNSAALVTSTFVEVGLEYALRLLSESVRANWISGTPMPTEYILMMSSLWAAAGGGPDVGRSTGAKHIEPEEVGIAVESESDLLSNPMLEGWYIDSHGVRAVARDVRAMGSTANALTHDNWRILLPALIRLAHDEFGPELRALYARRLRLMAEWFRMGGQTNEADMAAAAARTMMHSPPEANLLVLRLLQRGVLMSLEDWG